MITSQLTLFQRDTFFCVLPPVPTLWEIIKRYRFQGGVRIAFPETIHNHTVKNEAADFPPYAQSPPSPPHTLRFHSLVSIYTH